MKREELAIHDLIEFPIWELEIGEVAGHNLEVTGREEVNQLLAQGWILLQIYTLKYKENGKWRERPMAILGRTRTRKARQQPVNQRALH